MMIIIPVFQFFPNFQIRDCGLIAMFNVHPLLKTNRFYLKKKAVLVTTIPAHPFLPKTGECDVTLTSFTTDQSKP